MMSTTICLLFEKIIDINRFEQVIINLSDDKITFSIQNQHYAIPIEDDSLFQLTNRIDIFIKEDIEPFSLYADYFGLKSNIITLSTGSNFGNDMLYRHSDLLFEKLKTIEHCFAIARIHEPYFPDGDWFEAFNYDKTCNLFVIWKKVNDIWQENIVTL